MQIMTPKLLGKCLAACREELSRTLSADGQGEPNKSLHMDASALLDITAWRILTPFIVSLSAGVTAAAINSKWIMRQPIKGLQQTLEERVGQPIRVDPARTEECVILIEEILRPFAANRAQARKIVEVLTSTAQDD